MKGREVDKGEWADLSSCSTAPYPAGCDGGAMSRMMRGHGLCFYCSRAGQQQGFKKRHVTRSGDTLGIVCMKVLIGPVGLTRLDRQDRHA